jgi:hypothetical protein
MTDGDAALDNLALAEVEADLATLHYVLQQRGWHQDPEISWCWRWPATPPNGLNLFRAGPLILFDEEDPNLGYLVESPLLHDTDAPILQYESLEALIHTLDRIETWTYPQQAVDIDPRHAIRPGDARRFPD